MEERQERIQQAASRLLEMWKTGNMPEAIARSVIVSKQGNRPSSKWSLGNRLIQWAYQTEDSRGFHQWLEVGRQVKKGAKAIYIYGPLVKKGKDEETGEEKHYIYGFKAIPVFRYEDTDGDQLYKDCVPPVFPPLWGVAGAFGLTVEYKPTDFGYWGAYDPSRKEIELCTHDAKTYFHELAHAAHDQLLHEQGKTLKDESRKDREIVADTSAAVLCQLYGVEGFEAHVWEYVRGYADVESPEAVLKTVMGLLSSIELVVNLIMSKAEPEIKQIA